MSVNETIFAHKSTIRMALAVDESAMARDLAADLSARHSFVAPEEAEVLVVLGGDGFMLQQFRKMAQLPIALPLYGVNAGSVGFLLNHVHTEDLHRRILSSVAVRLHPLSVCAETVAGDIKESFAFNELSLFRASRQAAHLNIIIDDRARLENMICDGLLVATAAGSTAYNSACNGPILPLGAEILALTPISVFRPRRWRGALLPNRSAVRLQVVNADKRPVAAAADGEALGDITQVAVHEDKEHYLSLLFDPGESLDERIFKEQFMA